LLTKADLPSWGSVHHTFINTCRLVTPTARAAGNLAVPTPSTATASGAFPRTRCAQNAKPFQALLAAEPFNIQTRGSFSASCTWHEY